MTDTHALQALRDKVAMEIAGIRHTGNPWEALPQERFRRLWPSAQTAALKKADAILDALIWEAGK